MKRQLLVCIGLGVSLVAWANAGILAQGASQDAKAKTTTVTGCLAKGTDATSYLLRDATPAAPAAAAKEPSKEAPKSAEMKSYHVVAKESSLKLADHVGHKVTLTGSVEDMAFVPKGETPKAGASAGAKGSMQHLNVTAMKHVAATCTP
jgi:hypothetical protein